MKTLVRVLLLTTLGFSLLAGTAAAEVKLLKGQTLYVPCYTSMMSGTHSFEVKPVIFIHNTDPNNAINLVRMDFYNTSGKLMEKYLQQPQKLQANSATRLNLKELLTGEAGSGAHLIIQWQAENKVTEPLVQPWFIGAVGTRGYSHTSPVRIIQEDN